MTDLRRDPLPLLIANRRDYEFNRSIWNVGVVHVWFAAAIVAYDYFTRS